MKIIVWGIISTVVLFSWGVMAKNLIVLIGGITIGALTCLHYKFMSTRR